MFYILNFREGITCVMHQFAPNNNNIVEQIYLKIIYKNNSFLCYYKSKIFCLVKKPHTKEKTSAPLYQTNIFNNCLLSKHIFKIQICTLLPTHIFWLSIYRKWKQFFNYYQSRFCAGRYKHRSILLPDFRCRISKDNLCVFDWIYIFQRVPIL